jgi:hypothetical protein
MATKDRILCMLRTLTGALRRWRARENRRQHIRDGEEDAEIDPDDEGDIQAQMTPAPRGRRAR